MTYQVTQLAVMLGIGFIIVGANEANNSLPTDSVSIERARRAPYFRVDHSFVLSVEQRRKHLCSGVIVGADWALTSAHCVHEKNPEDMTLRSGASYSGIGGYVHSVLEILVHPQFEPSWENDYDLAMLRVEEFLTLSTESGRAISLATILPNPGSLAIVSGYGVNGILTSVQVPIVSHNTCKEDFHFIDGPLTDRILCAGFRCKKVVDANKEAGSPLVFRGELLGIGMKSQGHLPNLAKLYTNLVDTNLRAWIFQNAGVRYLL